MDVPTCLNLMTPSLSMMKVEGAVSTSNAATEKFPGQGESRGARTDDQHLGLFWQLDHASATGDLGGVYQTGWGLESLGAHFAAAVQ